MMLKDKVCVITGCNRGIGRETLKVFAEEGATVYANARLGGVLDEVAEKLEEQYDCRIIPKYFDITDSKSVKALFQEIQKEYGYMDVLVNNAGIMRDALIGMITKEMMQDIFNTNVFASMEMLQFAARLMRQRGKGSIINFTSIVGVKGNPGQMVYSASKGAVITMTKTAAKELAQYKIRVNAVAPGMIDTDMFRSVGDEKMHSYLDKIGFGRLGTPKDVANVCLLLASDYTEYVTGQIIGIDGDTII